MNPRPIAVTGIAWLMIAAGMVGLAYHSSELRGPDPFHWDTLLILCVRLLAVVCGIFLLRGKNWARWLTLAWMGFHVVVSGFHAASQLAFHSVLFLLLAYALLRAESAKYFRAGPEPAH